MLLSNFGDEICGPGLENATNTVANANSISSVVTKNSGLVATLWLEFSTILFGWQKSGHNNEVADSRKILSRWVVIFCA